MALSRAQITASSDEDKRKNLKDMDPDLMFLWTDSRVALVEQVMLSLQGYKTLKLFLGLADDKPGLRLVLKDDLGLDPAATDGTGPASRLQVACLLSAYETGREMNTRESQIRAEARTLGVKKIPTMPERTAMKRVVETAYGKMPTNETPSAEYLATKLEEVEVDEPKASPLDEVASLDDDDVQSLTTSVDNTGRIVVTKKKCKGKQPESPEEFRMKLRIEANVWLMLAAKFSNRAYLQDITPNDFMRYTDFFLGKRCYTMEVPIERGGVSATEALHPPWNIVLKFELECRKKAFLLVREENKMVGEALKLVMADSELKEIFFTSPLAIGGSGGGLKRKKAEHEGPAKWRQPGGPDNGKWPKQGKGKGKGKGKDTKGKGKGGKGLLASSPDGRQICFDFSTEGGCSKEGCARLHCCRYKDCLGLHSTLACPKHKQSS